jgi:uncharacterized membrane protein
MTILTKHWPPLLAIFVCLLGGFLCLPYLPSRIPVHWGIDGSISTYTNKSFGVYLNPAGMIVAYVFFTLIPYTDKRRVRDLRDIGVYEPLRNTAVYTFGFAQILVLGISLGVINPSTNFLIGMISLLLILAVESIQSGIIDPIKGMIPLISRVSSEQMRRVGPRLQASAGIGIFGSFFAPYPILWMIVPVCVSLLLEVKQAEK